MMPGEPIAQFLYLPGPGGCFYLTDFFSYNMNEYQIKTAEWLKKAEFGVSIIDNNDIFAEYLGKN